MKQYTQMSIRTKVDTFEWKFGKDFIASLYEWGGLILPEQISHNADKFVDLFVGGDECKDYWGAEGEIRVNGSMSRFHEDFAWRRKKTIKSTGYIRHKTQNIRSQLVPGSINFRSACSDKVDWYLLFKKWCEIFSPQLGCLHQFAGLELDPRHKNDSFQIGSFNSALKPDVPNIGWAMFYGDEFAEAVDADQIAAAGFPIEKIDNGYLVRVTENFQDVLDNFPVFSRRRAELKALFREEFFLIQHEPLVSAIR
ncbi:hypothetical protein [Pseudomonas veronii]|uniref:hypothetical protein n=1 Tax=Pseudomonas veronii TaxID=76761 RepID=UPI00061DD082|nr:hypothetical protein [Pseudomonas veronii]